MSCPISAAYWHQISDLIIGSDGFCKKCYECAEAEVMPAAKGKYVIIGRNIKAQRVSGRRSELHKARQEVCFMHSML